MPHKQLFSISCILLLLFSSFASAQVWDAGYSITGAAIISEGDEIEFIPDNAPLFTGITGMATVAPKTCYQTHLPSYSEYALYPEVKKRWDEFSAQTDGVCRFDNPDRPQPGQCEFVVELGTVTTGTTGRLCWYGKKQVQPLPPPPSLGRTAQPPSASPPAPVSGGFFDRIRSFFSNVFGTTPSQGQHSNSYEEAKNLFLNDVILSSTLGDTSVAIMHKSVLPAGTTILDGYFADMTLDEQAYFAWLDPDIEALYAHPTFYLFLYDDGELEVLSGNGWPIVNGQDLGQSGEKIYPTASSPTGSFVLGTPGIISATAKEKKGRHRRGKTAQIYELPEISAPPPPPPPKDCPPGYIKKEEPESEEGVSLTVLGKDHPRPNGMTIDFEGDVQRFAQATTAGKFNHYGPVTTPEEFAAVLSSLSKSLDPTSSFAMFISSHGGQLWTAELQDPITKERLTIENFLGEPQWNSIAIPAGMNLVSKKRTGWCFGLGDKCIKFDPNKHLKPLASCRKFLAANSCYGGAFTQHSVEGLSTYAGSTTDQPGKAFPFSGPDAKSKRARTYFGTVFTEALVNKPPADATKPQQDEPKPDFDSAYNAAASQIYPGKVFEIKKRNGDLMARVPIEQQPVQFSLPHKEVCGKKITCEPPVGIPTDDSRRPGRTCPDLLSDTSRIPAELEAMMKQGENYPYDKLEALTGMIQTLEELKKCYKCPPRTIPRWTCKPNGYELIDRMISLVRSYAQSGYASTPGTVAELSALSSELARCKLECLPQLQQEESFTLPKCSRGQTPDEDECRRVCKKVNGKCYEASPGCYACKQARPQTMEMPQVSPQIPEDNTPSQPPKDCETQCAEKAMTTQKQDWSSFILGYLNSHGVCKKNAEIKFANYLKNSQCTCYSTQEPSISISGEARCEDTECGTVDCNDSKTCSCGERCTITINCRWGGWRVAGQNSFVPVIQASS